MNPIKRSLKAGLHYSGISALYGRLFLQNKAVILGYHMVASHSAHGLHVTPEVFAMQMKYLAKHYQPLHLDELLTILRNNTPMPPRSCVVTFDDGTLDNFEVALPILNAFSIPATFFVIGSKLTAPSATHFNAQQANILIANGHHLGGHSHTHPHLTRVSKEQIKEELALPLQILRSTFAINTPAFAYPYGDFNPEIATVLKTSGYFCAVTTRPGFVQANSDLFALPRIVIDQDSTSTEAAFATRLQWMPRSKSVQ